jgi:hypothetical protein
MKKFTEFNFRTKAPGVFIFLIFLGFVCIGAWTSSSHSSSRNQQNSKSKASDENLIERMMNLERSLKLEDFDIINEVPKFEIVTIEKVDRSINLVLKNGYERNITAFLLSMDGDTTIVDTCVAPQSSGIAPGSTIEHYAALNVDPKLTRHNFMIAAVIFDDGKTRGDFAAVEKIQDYRRGTRMQMEHILPQLENVLNVPTEDIVSAMDKVKTNILTAPEKDSTLPLYTRSGISAMGSVMTRVIDKVKQGQDAQVKDRLIEILDYSRTKTAQLKIQSKKNQ